MNLTQNIFNSLRNNKVHCEKTGRETSIDNTRVVTKINGIINLKLFDNLQIDYHDKKIYSSNNQPINFFSKLYIPSDLKPVLGDLFSTVNDEDEIEQSTHILSDEGMKYLMGSQLIKLANHLNEYELINFPDTIFFVSVDETSIFKTQVRTCENCGITYKNVGKKYMIKKILDTKIESETFGRPSILWPGYDVGIGDCSSKNPCGTRYLFKTDRMFVQVNLCSNECTVEYCKKNISLAYYTDFMNGGKMRVLSEYTVSINNNLQNDYKFRSSNI